MKEAIGSWKAHSILLQVFKKTDKCHRENERKAGEAIRSIVLFFKNDFYAVL